MHFNCSCITLGKTTFIESLLGSNIIDQKWKTIYYCYPFELEQPPVDWDHKFEDINVQFLTELPSVKFFDTMEPSSLLVIDDLWTEATESSDVIKSFKVCVYLCFYLLKFIKVFSRKKNVSLIIVTQSYFSGRSGGLEIRNNW